MPAGNAQAGAAGLLRLRQAACSAVLAGAVALAPVLPSQPAAAADGAASSSRATQEVQRAYDSYASDYDSLDGGAAADALGFPQLRAQLLSRARGRVLEVAVGTGLNLRYYSWREAGAAGAATADPAAPSSASPAAAAAAGSEPGPGVSELVAVDLSEGMLGQARERAARGEPGALAARAIAFQQADVTALPFPDSSFDSVVDTFSLCVFPDPQAALNEVARVVRPGSAGGRVLLLEHTRSDNPVLAAYQDATAGPVAALGKGCVWNQDVEGLAARAGLQVLRAERSAAGTVELLEAVKR